MSANQVKFEVPDRHPEYDSLDQIKLDFTDTQIVEIVNRFFASQMTAKKSRLVRAEREKQVRAKVEAMAKAAGLTLDEYLARQ